MRRSSPISIGTERPRSRAELFRAAGINKPRVKLRDGNLSSLGVATPRRESAPLPAQHLTAKAFTPSAVVKTPTKKADVKTRSKFTNPATQSLLAREEKNKTCKMRPRKLEPRRAGGGASKKFVPWCKD